jgi:hypothetical protein
VFPTRDTARLIVLRHIDAQWRDDLSDVSEACRGETPPLRTPADVVERIAQIPTRFYIPSKCDRELLAGHPGFAFRGEGLEPQPFASLVGPAQRARRRNKGPVRT